jgi:hypothetical protein
MGDEHMISKRELLNRYGISYGALYRWKRKGLIPDEWFIKKSTVTGQETFFPERLICERVDMILAKKEDVLLDELARELHGVAQADEYLILHTEFGEKSFRLKDVKNVILVNAQGERTELITVIREKLHQS